MATIIFFGALGNKKLKFFRLHVHVHVRVNGSTWKHIITIELIANSQTWTCSLSTVVVFLLHLCLSCILVSNLSVLCCCLAVTFKLVNKNTLAHTRLMLHIYKLPGQFWSDWRICLLTYWCVFFLFSVDWPYFFLSCLQKSAFRKGRKIK